MRLWKMFKIQFSLLLTALAFGLPISCKYQEGNIDRGYYYWKSSNYSLDNKELLALKNQGIRKLYVKFFEVDIDTILGAVPKSKTEIHIWNYSYNSTSDSVFAKTMSELEIIPTIYIDNKVFQSSSKGSLDTLTDNIIYLIDRYYDRQVKNTQKKYAEIQIDCDWTEISKENYFYFLKKIKEKSKKTISCTLRLYPYKYRDKMGVPPVDKSVLMCYNLINPFASEDKNSILSVAELQSYLRKNEKYPIHLDIALPVFSWMQVYQNNQFTGIINPKRNEIENILKPIKPLWYEVTKDKEFDNLYLRVGDKIKFEDVTENTIKETITLLKKYIPIDSPTTIILFHLDSDNLNKFNNETICSFFTDFNK
jgi:hypothetical protein